MQSHSIFQLVKQHRIMRKRSLFKAGKRKKKEKKELEVKDGWFSCVAAIGNYFVETIVISKCFDTKSDHVQIRNEIP